MSKNTNEDRVVIFERSLSKRLTLNSEYFLVFSLSCGEDRTEEVEDGEEIDARFEISYEVHDVVTLRTRIHEVINVADLLKLYCEAKNGADYYPIRIKKSAMNEVNKLVTGSSHPLTIYIPLSGEHSMSDLVIEFVSSFFKKEYLEEVLENSTIPNPSTDIH